MKSILWVSLQRNPLSLDQGSPNHLIRLSLQLRDCGLIHIFNRTETSPFESLSSISKTVLQSLFSTAVFSWNNFYYYNPPQFQNLNLFTHFSLSSLVSDLSTDFIERISSDGNNHKPNHTNFQD